MTTPPAPFHHLRLRRGDDRPVRFGLEAGHDVVAVEAPVYRSRHAESPEVHRWSTANATAEVGVDNDGPAVFLLCATSEQWPFTQGVFDVWCQHGNTDTGAWTHESGGTIRLDGRGPR